MNANMLVLAGIVFTRDAILPQEKLRLMGMSLVLLIFGHKQKGLRNGSSFNCCAGSSLKNTNVNLMVPLVKVSGNHHGHVFILWGT